MSISKFLPFLRTVTCCRTLKALLSVSLWISAGSDLFLVNVKRGVSSWIILHFAYCALKEAGKICWWQPGLGWNMLCYPLQGFWSGLTYRNSMQTEVSCQTEILWIRWKLGWSLDRTSMNCLKKWRASLCNSSIFSSIDGLYRLLLWDHVKISLTTDGLWVNES